MNMDSVMLPEITESGHGKGLADGVGGVVRRTADELVNCGKGIPDSVASVTYAGN